MHVEIVVRQSCQLQREAPHEPGIVNQVSTPQPARLGCQTEKPFETDWLHPSRRLLLQTSVQIERGTYADQYRHRQASNVTSHPPFLLWSAQSHPHNVRLRQGNPVDHILFLGGAELAKWRRPGAGNRQSCEALSE